MGRTLHYSLTKNKGNLNAKEKDAIQTVSQKYNSANYEKLWSCESFYLNPYESKTPTNQLRGFTKTQGNELNSLMVLLALVELSQQVPEIEIHLSDEGEFLLCDLKIRNGKALPILKSLTDDIQRYCHLMLFSENYEGNILGKFNYKPTDFTHEFQMDCSIGNTYGDMSRYINEKLRNLKEVEDALLKQGLTGMDLYLFNLQQRDSKDWFYPFAFTRPVEVEKYIDCKMSPKTLMDGFSGEGFGLTTEDAELKSYKSIAKLQKLFGNSKLKLKVLGENA